MAIKESGIDGNSHVSVIATISSELATIKSQSKLTLLLRLFTFRRANFKAQKDPWMQQQPHLRVGRLCD